jgi:UDP-N-acetylglucosamine transferase subunit ALG13
VIFVTVGTQLPFDRLIATVDGWAARRPDSPVFAQVGPTSFEPRMLEHRGFISPVEFRRRTLDATGIVAHAGMGTILSALELGKPLLVMPRRAALGEHRNDHQLATARRFAARDGMLVAFDETELCAKLDELDAIAARAPIRPYASDSIIDALRTAIESTPQPV